MHLPITIFILLPEKFCNLRVGISGFRAYNWPDFPTPLCSDPLNLYEDSQYNNLRDLT